MYLFEMLIALVQLHSGRGWSGMATMRNLSRQADQCQRLVQLLDGAGHRGMSPAAPGLGNAAVPTCPVASIRQPITFD